MSTQIYRCPFSSNDATIYIGHDDYGWTCVHVDAEDPSIARGVGDKYDKLENIPLAGMVIDIECLYTDEDKFLKVFDIIGVHDEM
jgi:hypothetical protein